MEEQMIRALLACLLIAGMARAEGEPAGDFDYYVLSLSWSPTWCRLEGDGRGSPQCGADKDYGWVLHGLWPQYESGWPSYCRSSLPQATRSQTAAMADIMGTAGSAWHQWKKHGRCSGLAAEDFFDLARRAYDGVTRPPIFRKLPRTLAIRPSVIERAFLELNPSLEPDMLTVTCKEGYVQEVRICLTPDLTPRLCGADTVQDCRLDRALMDPIR